MSKLIKIKDQQYIAADSTYADDKVLVLNHADTFGIFDRWGDISLIGKSIQGIYYAGTRYVSELELKINGERPILLSSAVKEKNETLYANLTNPDIFVGEEIVLAKGAIHIGRSKFVKDGMCHEKIIFTNYDINKHELFITYSINADFKDIFEVRGMKRKKRGHITSINKNPKKISFTYEGLDNIIRTMILRFSPLPYTIEETELGYKICLEPQHIFEIKYNIQFKKNSQHSRSEDLNYDRSLHQLKTILENEKAQIADIVTPNGFFNHWINRSRTDLVSLIAHTPYGKYPYAGVPWYNTPFGRDGIITALEVLWVTPGIAKGVLLYLAQTQSKIKNDYQDAEPGKIFHETREGEMAVLGEIPFKLYYGTVDATPLFIVLAGAYYKRTGDLKTIKSIWPNIQAALKWIQDYGDIDGDGFVEYQHQSEQGLFNQGWKDSHDSVSYENGLLAQPPIALCEVQGYVYDAKIKAAFIANALGHKSLSASLLKEAALLKKRFNDVFWDNDLETYVLALDGEKKPCRVKSSNAGHCLFSGIVQEKYVERLTNTLLGPEMFSDWGIRTLSADAVRYNPMSYHNGSIWPHDNALIAYGLSKYGRQKEVLKILKGFFEAALFIDLQRLPELFCGFKKREEEGPVAYPVACSPQAWAVGTLFMLLQACIKIEIDAIEKKVFFHKPALPDFIDFIKIDNLSLANKSATVQLRRNNTKTGGMDDVTVNVISKPADWEVVIIK